MSEQQARKATKGRPSLFDEDMVRKQFEIPETWDDELAIFCKAKPGVAKRDQTDVIREALVQYLHRSGVVLKGADKVYQVDIAASISTEPGGVSRDELRDLMSEALRAELSRRDDSSLCIPLEETPRKKLVAIASRWGFQSEVDLLKNLAQRVLDAPDVGKDFLFDGFKTLSKTRTGSTAAVKSKPAGKVA